MTGGRDAGRQGDCAVDVVGLEDEVSANGLGVRPSGRDRNTVDDSYGGRLLGATERKPGRHTRGLVQRRVVGIDRLLLSGGERWPSVGVWEGGGGFVDE